MCTHVSTLLIIHMKAPLPLSPAAAPERTDTHLRIFSKLVTLQDKDEDILHHGQQAQDHGPLRLTPTATPVN
jgi:hypothetical protein